MTKTTPPLVKLTLSEQILNKLLYIFLFFFCLNTFGQDSLSVVKTDSVTVASKFSEKDIIIDSTKIKERSFSNFKEKYSDSSFDYEPKSKEKSAWERFKEWLAYWYNKIFSLGNDEASMSAVELILKILAVIVILFVIYLIVKAIMNDEGQWIFGKSSDKKVIHYDEIEKNLHLVDFEKLIKEAVKSGENRLAIRYYYLWLLKELASKEIIEWDIEKTNSDYLYEIKNEKLRNDFAYLSYLYNYIWYGEFELGEETFSQAIQSFEKTIKTL